MIHLSPSDSSLCRPLNTEKVLHDILAERRRQDGKWGQQDHTPEKWQMILAEEIGEACRAHMELDITQYRKEMIEAAAVIAAAVEAFDRRERE